MEINLNKRLKRLNCFLYTFGIAIILGASILVSFEFIDILKILTLSIVLTGAALFYIHTHLEMILADKNNTIIITVGYSLSLSCVMISSVIQGYYFWILGILMIAMIVDTNVALIFNLLFSILLCFTQDFSVEILAYYFIIGFVASLIASYIKKLSSLIYVIIILVSIDVSMSFIIHNFNLKEVMNTTLIFNLISLIFVVLLAYIIRHFYDQMEFQNLEKVQALPDSKLTIEELLSPDMPLLIRLKNQNMNLYNHCIDVGEISSMAAKLIGAKDDIAKVGGLFHEIGRLRGKNYVEEGVKIATVVGFPQCITDIIMQHNLKYDKPKTIEAAIVMLTDSVITTLEYLQKNSNDKNISENQLIDNIFNIRLSKGTLNECGLTIEQFNKLKEFYRSNFF